MNKYPEGNWKDSSRNIEYINVGVIKCELRKIDGTYKENTLCFEEEASYENNNGDFIKILDFKLPLGTWKDTSRNIQRIKKEGSEFLSFELRDISGNYKLNNIPYNPKDIIHNIDGNAVFQKENYQEEFKDVEIPKKIFQTHKNMEYMLENQVTVKSYNNWSKYEGYEYNFYDDKKCEEFIKTNFENKVYEAYKKCPLSVMKADLWRYCVVYHFGGIYADADTVCLKHPDILLQKNAYLVCVPENKVHLCNWVFAAPKNSPILRSIINLSVYRILNEYKVAEHFIHQLTGPGVFTDGIEEYLKSRNLLYFENKNQYPESYKNYYLHVFNLDFHQNTVRHFYNGGANDGWCKERDEYVKKIKG